MRGVALARIDLVCRFVAEDCHSILIEITPHLHVAEEFVGAGQLGPGQVSQLIRVTVRGN